MWPLGVRRKAAKMKADITGPRDGGKTGRHLLVPVLSMMLEARSSTESEKDGKGVVSLNREKTGNAHPRVEKHGVPSGQCEPPI